jgi:hypothetical protein
LGVAGARVRARDPALFFASLFAPAEAREAMWLVHGVHGELMRALSVSEKLVGAMRVQWWREVAEGAARRHELATPLAAAFEAGSVPREAVLALCEAADAALEDGAPGALWRGLGEAFGMVLGVEDAVRERLGALWGALGAGEVPAASRWPRAALPAALPAAARRAELGRAELGRAELGRARMPRVAMLRAVVLRRA